MKFVEDGVLLTPEEYHKYQRMEACINELKSLRKTDFIQSTEVEAWSSDQDSNQIMTSKSTSTHLTASTKPKTKKSYAWNVANARRNTMTSKPARLGKGCHADFLDDELTISVRAVLIIALMTALFFALCFLCKGPTMGYL